MTDAEATTRAIVVIATAMATLGLRLHLSNFWPVIVVATTLLAWLLSRGGPPVMHEAFVTREALMGRTDANGMGAMERLAAVPSYAKDAIAASLDTLIKAMKPKDDGSDESDVIDDMLVKCPQDAALCNGNTVDPNRFAAFRAEMVSIKALFGYMEQSPLLALLLDRVAPTQTPAPELEKADTAPFKMPKRVAS